MSLTGVGINAVCVALCKTAAFGVDPFQSLMSGLDCLIPISFGTLYVIINALLLVFSLILDRKKIGIATLINLFLYGYITEFALKLIGAVCPAPSVAVRIAFLAAGVVIMCLGSALYMTAALGVSTYDAVAMILAEKRFPGKFRYIRIATDVLCILLGLGAWLLGRMPCHINALVGIGTVLAALCMGPLIEFFNRKVARPLLEGRKKDL